MAPGYPDFLVHFPCVQLQRQGITGRGRQPVQVFAMTYVDNFGFHRCFKSLENLCDDSFTIFLYFSTW
jgi:hypothetical protein